MRTVGLVHGMISTRYTALSRLSIPSMSIIWLEAGEPLRRHGELAGEFARLLGIHRGGGSCSRPASLKEAGDVLVTVAFSEHLPASDSHELLAVSSRCRQGIYDRIRPVTTVGRGIAFVNVSLTPSRENW
jgi:hypothetical protein